MAVELPQPILDDEKLLAKICGMEVEAPTYIPGISPRLYAYMAKKGGQDVEVPDPILRLECYWYDYAAGSPPSVQEYTGAVPVTFVADGTPLLDYLISGNTVQSGTPTPDTPVMPQGTGERTGNLYNTTATDWTLGILDDNGQPTGSTSSHYTTNYTEVLPQTAYLLSGTISTTGSFRAYFYSSDKSWIGRTVQKTTGDFTTPQNCFYIRIQVTVTIEDTSDWMLNLGSTAPSTYIPYGYKIPISSANTTTPVYLGEVETTRKVKKLVLSSSQNWQLQSINSHGIANFYITITNDFLNNTSILSNYFVRQATTIADTTTEGMLVALSTNSATVYIRINSQTASTAQEFKDWLDGLSEEAAIWYVLATVQTAVVNEPLMKIGDYADTLSMEQAGAQIPTANGSTTLDVETTVKPSEVYIKYRGEAVATLSALSAEVSSPETTPEEENLEETEEEENER